MRLGRTSLLVALTLLTTSIGTIAGFISPESAVNEPPTAQHGDRAVEDGNGDGEVTIRFEDTQSEDPDAVHMGGDPPSCGLWHDPNDGPSLSEWRWYNATGLNDTEFEDQRMDRFLSLGEASKELTFGIGEYKIALQVEDHCDATGWANFTLEIRPERETLYEFDGGSLGPEWTTTGLWRLADDCEEIGGEAPWLAYTEQDKDSPLASEDCDYEEGGPKSGYAKLVVFDPSSPGSGDGWHRFAIDFDHYFDVGTYSVSDEDRMIFEASFDGGETWVGSEHTDTGCGDSQDDEGKNCWDDDSESPGWDTQTNVFDIRDQDYTGGEVQFRWMFDTTTIHDNDNKGWFIDNIQIYGLVEN